MPSTNAIWNSTKIVYVREKIKVTEGKDDIPPASSGNTQDIVQALQQSSSADGNKHDLQETVLEIAIKLLVMVNSVERHTCGEVRKECAAVAAILLNKTDPSGDPSLFWPSMVETSADFEWGSAVEMTVFRPSNAMSGMRGAGEGARKGVWRMGDRWFFWRCACR